MWRSRYGFAFLGRRRRQNPRARAAFVDSANAAGARAAGTVQICRCKPATTEPTEPTATAVWLLLLLLKAAEIEELRGGRSDNADTITAAAAVAISEPLPVKEMQLAWFVRHVLGPHKTETCLHAN